MSPLSWTFRQLMVFWAGAAVIAAVLWKIGGQLQPGPWKFFWLLPARNPAHGLWLASCAFFVTRPFEAVAVLVVPAATLVVTALWIIGRVAQ